MLAILRKFNAIPEFHDWVLMTIGPEPPAKDLLITGELLQRAKNGDRGALEALMTRYRPRLERWASGRLPSYARSLFDTGDLIQETLLKALGMLDQIEVGGPGMFQAYVRQAILNRIRDQVRWARRRPGVAMPEDIAARTASPLESAIESDVLDQYERALAKLSEEERQVLHLRVELDFSYGEIATIMEQSSPDAVRMTTRRALRKLSKIMEPEG